MDNITVEIMDQKKTYKKGTTLLEILDMENVKDRKFIVVAAVDNEIEELTYPLKNDCKVEYLKIDDPDGMRTYMRSLSYIFTMACNEIIPECRVTLEHTIGKGLYCEVHECEHVTGDTVKKIEECMREIVQQDMPLEKMRVSNEDAVEIFKKFGHWYKVRLMEYREAKSISIYKCGNFSSYFYGYMVPSTGYLKTFRIKACNGGIVIIGPRENEPEKVNEYTYLPKLAEVFRETEEWAKIMDVNRVASLNDTIKKGDYPNLIRTVEALHEKKISKIADMINHSDDGKRLVLISGPSSSGKTSFAQRLMIQLRVNKMNPVSISLDNYFVNRDDTPLDENGNYDFESINSIDIKLFNEHLEKLIAGYEVEIPYFNFKTGKREYRGDKLKISKKQPVLVEGIHGLNEILSQSVRPRDKFKIYVSALTQLNLDEHNRIPTTDLRLIRRIVRDHSHRGNDALKTLNLWNSVRAGEEKNIFPFQEEADVMFNSALVYELAVLKKYASPLLKSIDRSKSEYREARRLLSFLQYFVSIEEEADIPPTSILREFIGGSRLVSH